METTTALRLKTLSELQLSQVAYGLGQLGVIDTSMWIAVTKEVTDPERLGHFDVHGLCNILHALAEVSGMFLEVPFCGYPWQCLKHNFLWRYQEI